MTDVKGIIELIRINKIQAWDVRTRNTGRSDVNTYIFKSDPDKNMEDNISTMVNVLDHYKGKSLSLIGKDSTSANSNRGQFYYEFSNVDAPQSQAIVSGMSNVDIDARIDAAIQKTRYEFMSADLERRERELKQEIKEYNAERNSVIGIAVQQIGKIIPKVFPQRQLGVAGVDNEHLAAPVAATHHEVVEEQINLDAQRAEDLICRFAAVEPQWLELLESVVVMAESGDATYTMAKGFLIKS